MSGCLILSTLEYSLFEGDTPRPITLYRKLVVAANKLIAQAKSDWFMFNVTDQKLTNIYERFTQSIKGYSCQRADEYFYLYRDYN